MGGEQGHTPGAARLDRRDRAHAADTGGVAARRRIALLALVAVMVVWGTTFVVTKAALREFPPFTLAFLRFAIATMVLVPLLRRGALVELRGPCPLAACCSLRSPGSLCSRLRSTSRSSTDPRRKARCSMRRFRPSSAICAVLFLKERLSRRRIFGIALSMAGAALIVATGEPRTGDAPAPLLGPR